MTYRDESIALRERLVELDAERHAAEGRAAGLRVAVAEARQAAADAEASLAALPRRSFLRKLLGGALGVALALGLGGGLCLGFGVLVSHCGGIELRRQGRALSGLPPTHTRCDLRIDDGEGRTCAATLGCSGRPVYRGWGTCATSTGGLVEYWDHGPEGLVYVEAEGHAIARGPDGPVVVEIQRR